MNLVDAVLQERDRLLERKRLVGRNWNDQILSIYRVQWQDLFDRATEAIGGRMHVTEMLVLYGEMQEFE